MSQNNNKMLTKSQRQQVFRNIVGGQKAKKNKKKVNKQQVKQIRQDQLIQYKPNPRKDVPWVQELLSEVGDIVLPGRGGNIGRSVGKGISRLFGSGDYTVQSNSVLDVPQFVSNGNVRVKHREYITDVLSSQGFVINTYSVNPGLPLLFPWLCSLADNYQEYRIHGMVFSFRSTCGSAISSTNNAMGTVIISSQYNPLDPQFTSKFQMDNNEFTTSNKPDCSFLHGVECKKSQTTVTNLYVRTPITSTSNSDIRLYDFLNISIATVGMQQSSVGIGEFWVTYDIELFKPKISNWARGISSYFTLNSPSTTNYLGSSVTVILNSLGISYNTSSSTITLPAYISGNFIVEYFVFGSSTAGVAPPIATLSGGLSSYAITGSSVQSSPINITSTNVSVVNYVTAVNGGSITYAQNMSYALPSPTSISFLNISAIQ